MVPQQLPWNWIDLYLLKWMAHRYIHLQGGSPQFSSKISGKFEMLNIWLIERFQYPCLAWANMVKSGHCCFCQCAVSWQRSTSMACVLAWRIFLQLNNLHLWINYKMSRNFAVWLEGFPFWFVISMQCSYLTIYCLCLSENHAILGKGFRMTISNSFLKNKLSKK